MAGWSEEDDEILLYYKYAPIPDVSALHHFYESNCTSLALLGRVRIAPQGVNVTIGGKMSSLLEHISALKSDNLFDGTDFKLASCRAPSHDGVAKESGFTSLSIRVLKELVTFSSHPLPAPPTISNAGKHLSALKFHSFLQPDDTRNIYETRIGRFNAPNVETLDSKIRQHSDLPDWVERNSHQLQGKTVLIYCAGGIRCEMASAYIRSKGAGFESVYQLYGGIQRYMEDGGFFKVGRLDGCTIGSCQLCASPFDDYSARCRCRHCRMLVLVRDNCQNPAALYSCELCKKHSKDVEQTAQLEKEWSHSASKLSISDIGATSNYANEPMEINQEQGKVAFHKENCESYACMGSGRMHQVSKGELLH